jgi:hypothetical protein
VNIGEKFDSTLRDLKITCKSKTTVPVDQVYVLEKLIISRNLSNWLKVGKVSIV